MAVVWVRSLWRLTLLCFALQVLLACKGDPDKKRAPPCYTSEDCIPEGKDADCLEGICENNECRFESLNDGLTCDDGDVLTLGDTCNSGECIGSAEDVVECDEEPGPCEELETDPETGECSIVAKPDGEPCDDDSQCTQLDLCEAGECVGSEPVDCSATDDCHEDGECDPATGECSAPEAPDGTTCDDGLVCTEDDSCEAGSCVGVTLECDDERSCSIDACQEDAGGCTYDVAACSCDSDSDCDDGNPCNGSESCDAETRSCQPGVAIDCAMLDDECTRGTCDPDTAECVAMPAADGTACEDGDLCTASDTCQEGACVGGADVVCEPLNGCHDAGVCDPASGLCDNPQKQDGSECTDNNACTEGDSCEAGACVGGEPRVCSASDQCHTAGTCDPATGACTDPPAIDGATCDDGDLCTETDSCQGGRCIGDNEVECTALDDCHLVGECNPSTGVCSNPVAEDGTSCSDGLLCTAGDQCVAGNCEAAAITCNDNVACSQDSCSEETGGCVFDTSACPCTTNSECDDNNPCNGVETCNLSNNTCAAGTPVDCSHLSDACNTGSCQPENGECRALPRANGAACNDGNQCTQSDTCQAGLCVGQSPIRCAPEDQCHDAGVCNPNTGTCSNPTRANDSPCDDGDLCTQSDTCQAGSCVGTSPVTCVPSSQCHDAGVCNPNTGACTNPTRQNGAACDDGSLCTLSDACQGGVCTSNSAVSCSASDQCHARGTCNPSTGECTNPVRPNGTPCNDSDLCTQSDACQAGECQGAGEVVCTAQDQCHTAGVCDSQTGLCDNPIARDGTSCNDSDECTRTDACESGICLGTDPVTCSAISQCHDAGSCDPVSGQCTNPPAPGTTSCDDDNACTVGETCSGDASASCAGGTPVSCPPASGQCRLSSCDPDQGCIETNRPDNSSCNDNDQCTRVDVCRAGVCAGGSLRDNRNGAWSDAPGMTVVQRLGLGPHSIDLFTHERGGVGAVGTYSGAIAFDDSSTPLVLPRDCNLGLFWVVYVETTGAVASADNIGCGSGALTVTHAARHTDDGFSIVGQFSGSVSFGRPGANMLLTAERQSELFIARYESSGDIAWVVRGLPGGNQGTVDSVASFEDDSVVVVGTSDENISFFDADGNRLGATPGAGVWTAVFTPDGGLGYRARVVTPGQGSLPTARAVTTHRDGRWTMTGTFYGTEVFFGPGQEAAQSSLGAADVWVLDLTADGDFNWVARVGSEVSSDSPGDVTALNEGAVMLIADTIGAVPSADDVSRTALLREVGPRLNTHVLRFESDGQLSRAALIADPSSGYMDSYQIGRDATGAVSIAGTFSGRLGLYGDVGFGGGSPPNAADIDLVSDGLSLILGRLDEGCGVHWAIAAGGIGSGMTSQADWDIVATDHPSRAVTLAGMFSTQARFGYSLSEVLVSKGPPGSPFVVHLNSEAELDYCQ